MDIIFRITWFLWIVGLVFTIHTVARNVQHYLEYDSIVTESSHISKNPEFPEIIVCSETMHSLKKGNFIKYFGAVITTVKSFKY